MTANPGKDTESRTIAFDDLKMLLASIFEKNGTSATVAHILADTVARADRDGARSHGLFAFRDTSTRSKAGMSTAMRNPSSTRWLAVFCAWTPATASRNPRLPRPEPS